MRLLLLLSVFLALAATRPADAQPHPEAGKPYTVHYLSRSDGPFRTGEPLELLYVFDYWNVRYGTRLALWYNVLRPDTAKLRIAELTPGEGGWSAVIDVPDDAALLSYIVRGTSAIDGNGERTYVEYVRGADGKPVRNARYFNVQFLRLARAELGALLREAEMEVIAYPDNFPAYHQYFSLLLEQEKGSPRAQQRIIQKLDELEKQYGADADFLNLAARTYHYLLLDTETAVSYRNRIPLDKQWPEVLKIYDRDARVEEQEERSSRMRDIREKLIGAQLPDFQLRGYDGSKVPFPAKNGKPAVLCFWMQGSDKCRNMLLEITEHHRRHGTAVDFIAVSVDRDVEKTREYLARNPLSFPALHNQGSTLFVLGVESVPTTYLVDADGIVRDVLVGYSPETSAALQAFVAATAGER